MPYTLIIGGASSGKSRYVINLLKEKDNVTFIATGLKTDKEMEERIKKHRAERPPEWNTIEEPCKIIEVLHKKAKNSSYIIIDCLTFWISNLIYIEKLNEQDIKKRAEDVSNFLETIKPKTFVITNELGMSLIPENPENRKFRIIAGEVNQIFANNSKDVYLIVSGLPVKIK